jgi:hypothetical protein
LTTSRVNGSLIQLLSHEGLAVIFQSEESGTLKSAGLAISSRFGINISKKRKDSIKYQQ